MAKQTTVLEAKIDAKGVKSGAAAIKRELGLVGKSAKGLQDNFDNLQSKILGTFSAGALTAFAVKTQKSVLEVGRLSDQLDISASSLDGFSRQAKRVGVDTDTLADAFKELGIRIVEAEQLGSGPAVDALNLLGISLQEIKDLKPDEQFLLIADALGDVENAAERVFIQEELMGDAGARLAPLINKGADAMRQFNNEAREAGGLIDDGMVQTAREVNETWHAINDELDSAFLSLVRDLSPSARQVANYFSFVAEQVAQISKGIRQGEVKEEIAGMEFKVKSLNNELAESVRKLNVLRGIEAGKGTPERDAALAARKAEIGEIKERIEAANREMNILRGEASAFLDLPKSDIPSDTKPRERVRSGGLRSVKEKERLIDLEKEAAAIIRANRTNQEVLEDRLIKANELRNAGLLERIEYEREVMAAQDEYRDGLSDVIDAEKERLELQQELQDSIVDTFTDGIKAGKDFKDILGDIAAEMVNMILKGEDLGGIFGGGTPGINPAASGGGGGGLLNTAISAAGSFFGDIGSGIASIFGFADGGRPPTDRPSIVGERGPELFIPDGAGVVVPNGGFGGDTINVYYSPQVNALDPRTAADVIAQNAPTVVGIVQQSFNQQGLRGIRR